MNNPDFNKIIHQVSLETYTEKDIVNKIIELYYQMCKEELESAIKDDADSYPKIMIPYVGKILVDRRLVKRNKTMELRRNAKDQNPKNEQRDE